MMSKLDDGGNISVGGGGVRVGVRVEREGLEWKGREDTS